MIEGSLGRRYAKALFQLAVAQRREEDVGREIHSFLAALQSAELSGALNNPAFAVESRKNIVVEVARSLQLSPLVVHFLSMLLERDRLSFFPGIVERYRRLLDEKKGQAEARVVSVTALAENDLNRLREALEKISSKKVVIHQESDPSLIGGVIVRLEGKIYDGSVRAQLQQIRKQVEQG